MDTRKRVRLHSAVSRDRGGAARARAAARTVVVTLTFVEAKPGQRAQVIGDARKALDDLPNHAGLLGHSFRVEWIGRRAWTMTVWENEEARDAFVAAPVHRAAVRRSGAAAQAMRFVSLAVPASEVPLSWIEVRRRCRSRGGAKGAYSIEMPRRVRVTPSSRS